MVIYQRQVASIVGKGNVTLEKVKVLGDVVIGGKATIKDSIIRGLVTCRSTDLTIVGSQIDTLNITFDQGEPVLVLENPEVETVVCEGTNAKVICIGTSQVGQTFNLMASNSKL